MSEPILTFNAKSVDAKILEKTLIGRREILEEIYASLIEKLSNDETFQSLIVAPRGSGKTHMTKIIFDRLRKEEFKDKFVIAYMIEDEYGISSFTHLLIQILLAIHRYGEHNSQEIPAKIQEISGHPSNKQEHALGKLLLNHLQEKSLVVLVENFDTILDGMGSGGASLRDFMHEHNKISLIATSQSLSKQFKDSQYPFYQFFRTRHLAKLTFDQSFDLIRSLIEVEENQELKKQLKTAFEDSDEMESKIRAIYQLTMGNHRLLVHFYSFLKADLKSELSVVFVKQMNDLKTYYEQFIKALSVQQQRIVQLISLSRNPIKGKEIAQQTFLKPNVVSKQLSELFKMGYIDKNRVGKDAYYEIKEPLMRICFEINENPDGTAKLFIDFLKVIYDNRQLKQHYLRYKYGARHYDESLQYRLINEANMYEKALRNKDLEELNGLAPGLLVCEPNELEKKISDLGHNTEFSIEDIYLLFEQQEYQKIIDVLLPLIESRQSSHLSALIGNAYYHLKYYIEAIENYSLAIKLNPENHKIYNNLGNAYYNINNSLKAIENYSIAIKLNTEDHYAYYNLGNALLNTHNIESAYAQFMIAYNIKPDDPWILGSLVRFHIQKTELDQAKKFIQELVSIQDMSFSDMITTDILIPIYKYISAHQIQEYIQSVYDLCKKQKRISLLMEAIPHFIFNILIQYEEIPRGNLGALPEVFNDVFKDNNEITIPLNMYKHGLAYLIDGDERTLYNLSKEERQVFEDFVLIPRKELKALMPKKSANS